MTIKRSWLTSALVISLSTILIAGCSGKKSRAEKASVKQATAVEDITLPPTIIQAKDDQETDADED